MPTLSIDIEARFAQALDAIKQIDREVTRASKKMEAFSSNMRTLGAAAGVVLFARAVMKSIDEVEDLGRAVEKTGLSIEKISGLKFAAALEDIDFDTLQQGLLHFNKALDENSKSFARIGVNIKGLSPEQTLDKTADAFAKMADGSGKSAIAMDLFGKSGAQLIPVLNQGTAGLADAARQAEQFGLIIRGPTLEASRKFKDQMDLLEQASKGATLQIATRMLPALTQIATAAAQAAQESGVLTAAFVALGQAGKTAMFGADPNAIGKQAKFVEQLKDELASLNEEFFKIQSGDLSLPLDEMGLSPMRLRSAEELRLKIREIGVVTLPAAENVLKRMRAEADALAKALKKPTEQPGARENDQVKQRLDTLNKELAAAEKLSEMEKVVLDVYSDRLGVVSRLQKAELYAAARAVDAARLEISNQKALAEAAEHRLDSLHDADLAAIKDAEGLTASLEAQAKALRDVADPLAVVQRQINDLDYLQATLGAAGLNAEQEKAVRLQLQLQQIAARHAGPAEQFLNAIDPARQYRIELEKIGELERQGALDQVQAAQARAQVQKQIDTSDRDLEHIRDLVEPTRELRRELDEVDKKFAAGFIDEQQATRAKQIINRDILQTLAAAGDRAAQTKLVLEDSLVDPFIDLVNQTKTADEALKSFFQNVGQSLLRLEAQRLARDVFGGGGGDSLLFSIGRGIGGLFTGASVPASGRMAMGGVMTPQGPINLDRYAGGGIASRPQLALFGEGSKSEAFVPLPDGRAIPVQMRTQEGGRMMAGPSAMRPATPEVRVHATLTAHPDMLHMTLRDFLEGEYARALATR